MSSSLSSAPPRPRLHRIFAYGASMTAGYVSPSHPEYYPYAPYLEEALKKQQQPQEREHVVATHLGLPGWTAAKMVATMEKACGLKWILAKIHKQDPPLSIVMILAGTNDLAGTSTELEIAGNLIALHKASLAAGVRRTIAIGIPPSGYQSVNPMAAARQKGVNEILKQYCKHERRATFFPFPFGFSRNDVNWAKDSLHFSEHGYRKLGESLAPVVESILQEVDQEEAQGDSVLQQTQCNPVKAKVGPVFQQDYDEIPEAKVELVFHSQDGDEIPEAKVEPM